MFKVQTTKSSRLPKEASSNLAINGIISTCRTFTFICYLLRLQNFELGQSTGKSSLARPYATCIPETGHRNLFQGTVRRPSLGCYGDYSHLVMVEAVSVALHKGRTWEQQQQQQQLAPRQNNTE